MNQNKLFPFAGQHFQGVKIDVPNYVLQNEYKVPKFKDI
jgi:hypothetical protein